MAARPGPQGPRGPSSLQRAEFLRPWETSVTPGLRRQACRGGLPTLTNNQPSSLPPQAFLLALRCNPDLIKSWEGLIHRIIPHWRDKISLICSNLEAGLPGFEYQIIPQPRLAPGGLLPQDGWMCSGPHQGGCSRLCVCVQWRLGGLSEGAGGG